MNTKFFTGDGDKGESGFGDIKLPKSHILFRVLGSTDEVNVLCGWARMESEKEGTRVTSITRSLLRIQELLFILQAELASHGFKMKRSIFISDAHVRELEEMIARIDEEMQPITKFIIPGGSELSTRLEFVRVASRELERLCIEYHEQSPLGEDVRAFCNRLSSVFYALSRSANMLLGKEEQNPSYH